MINDVIVLTVVSAFGSAAIRGAISVLDRKQFGLLKSNIRIVNMLNNLLAVFVLMIILTHFVRLNDIIPMVLDYRIIFFAILLQVSAYSFSFAYKRMEVHQVIVIGKSADLFIPFSVYLFTYSWNSINTIFSVATFLVCLPVLFKDYNNKHFSFGAAFFVIIFLVLQGGLSKNLVFISPSSNMADWLIYLLSILIWRFFISLFAFLSTKKMKILLADFFNSKNQVFLTIVRSFLTIFAQGLLIIAVGSGMEVVAWPILNSTGIIAVIFSTYYIKEKPDVSHITAIVMITILSLIRLFI